MTDVEIITYVGRIDLPKIHKFRMTFETRLPDADVVMTHVKNITNEEFYGKYRGLNSLFGRSMEINFLRESAEFDVLYNKALKLCLIGVFRIVQDKYPEEDLFVIISLHQLRWNFKLVLSVYKKEG
jgi:hypothetical protein